MKNPFPDIFYFLHSGGPHGRQAFPSSPPTCLPRWVQPGGADGHSRDGYGSLQGQSELQLFSAQPGLTGQILLPEDASLEGPTFFDALDGKNTGCITGLRGKPNGPGQCTYSIYLNQWSFGAGQ